MCVSTCVTYGTFFFFVLSFFRHATRHDLYHLPCSHAVPGAQEDTAEYGARDDADPKGMQRVVDELLEKVRFCFHVSIILLCASTLLLSSRFDRQVRFRVHLLMSEKVCSICRLLE